MNLANVYRHAFLRPMEIGDIVVYRGRRYVLCGLDPMSLDERCAELEDEQTGEHLRVPVDDVEPGPA